VGRYFDIGVAPWSGVELLVWGGANGLDYLDTGGRYNPRTDTWWPTATSLAPTARFRHTTTWCGSNLVVFGGLGPTNYERSGAAYTVRPQSFSCSASATPAAGSVPLEVAFEAAAVPEGCDGVSTFAWSFGDGGTSGLSNPTHVYQSPGTFGWTVTASTNGSLCSSQGTVVVTPPCALDCTAEVLPVTGVAPLTVHCAATAPSAHCDGAPAFAWSFGDGGTSQEQNPGHTYAEAGTYGWTLVVNQGGQTCTKTGSVTAIAPCTLDCAASATPASGTAPLAVVFAADAAPSGCAGSPAFSWNFGDGESSSQQDPSHSYSSPGAYTWTLAVSQDGKVCERTGTVTVSAPCTLSCSAGAAPTSGTAPLDVAFTALWASNGCAGDPAFAWDFGDGGSSAEQNPSHRYTVAGARTWTLTVTQAGSTCSKTGDIEVRAGIPGDCDGDGQVSIGEVQKAINMFLGILPVGCGVDCNGDGSVSIGEVQKVINAFLGLTVSC
jgi:PKD repeat protein